MYLYFPTSYLMIFDYCSLFLCTILTKVIINFFNDINFKHKKGLRKRFIDKDILVSKNYFSVKEIRL